MTERFSSAHVLDHIRGMIARGELAPGSRLPPERRLAEELQINRATLRKALGRLELEGAITRHVGRGTFLGGILPAPAGSAQSASPMELMEARCAIEPVIAREAALRARKEQLARLRLCIARGDEAEQFEQFETWDIAFHRALAEATANPIMIMIMDVMRQMRAEGDWERLKRSSFGPALREQYRAEHKAIFRAVEDRDPVGAAAAMLAHTQAVRSAIERAAWGETLKGSPAAVHPA